MAPTVTFYFRAPQPGFPSPAQLVEATKVVFGESEETLMRLASELAAAKGYLSDQGRKAILSRVLGADLEKISRFATLLDIGEDCLKRRDGIDGLLSTIEKYVLDNDAQNPTSLTQDEFFRLKHLLPIIFVSYPARQRQAKAELLADATGLRAETVDLICDIRPIFNDERTNVEGIIPFTTLRIVAAGVDGFPIFFEAILAASDVQDLLKKAEAAVAKLNALGRLAEQAQLPVPSVGLTETRE